MNKRKCKNGKGSNEKRSKKTKCRSLNIIPDNTKSRSNIKSRPNTRSVTNISTNAQEKTPILRMATSSASKSQKVTNVPVVRSARPSSRSILISDRKSEIKRSNRNKTKKIASNDKKSKPKLMLGETVKQPLGSRTKSFRRAFKKTPILQTQVAMPPGYYRNLANELQFSDSMCSRNKKYLKLAISEMRTDT
ncbi:hypothetical protein HHI36_017498 [Cryptolaemus montrouzieri]|uniref:Uncharacterized protein n=1 Tax=Cryptolaemus montrouzieri TaxID=559131 RepID=A0ABD2NNG9_9CUCU